MKKVLLFILIVILLSTISYAADTIIQVPTDSPELTIVYPKSLFFKRALNFSLNFDILDSNLTRLDNTTTNCTIFISNSVGGVIDSGDLKYSESSEYWFYNVSGSDVGETGPYSFYVHCENILENGFLSTAFIINTNGENPADNEYYILAIPLALILVSFLFLYLAFKLEPGHFLLKLLSLFFALINLMIVPSVFVSSLYTVETQFVKLVTWFFRLFITYIVLFLIYHWATQSEAIVNMIDKGRRKMGFK